MKTHAALPHRQNFEGMSQIKPGLVEQAITQSPAQHHSQDAPKQNVVHITPAPSAIPTKAGKRRVLEAQGPQPQKETKAHQIRQAVPMYRQRPQLQGYGINLGVHQHAAIVPQGTHLHFYLQVNQLRPNHHGI